MQSRGRSCMLADISIGNTAVLLGCISKRCTNQGTSLLLLANARCRY